MSEELTNCEKKVFAMFKDKVSGIRNEPKIFSENFDDLDLKSSIGKLSNDILYKLLGSVYDYDEYILNNLGTNINYFMIQRHSHWFSFTEPIVDIEKDGQIKKCYKNIKVGDKLLIWQTLQLSSGGEKAGHLVGHIISANGSQYSFGFGFLGGGELQRKVGERLPEGIASSYIQSAVHLIDTHKSSIYTPDHLFEQAAKRQVVHPKGKFLRLIAASVLNKENIETFYKMFDRVRPDNYQMSRVTLSQIPTDLIKLRPQRKHMGGVVEFLHRYAKNFDEDTRENIKTSLRYTNMDKELYCFSMINFFNIEGIEYCEFSRSASGLYYNCAKFLQKLFGTLIECKGDIMVVNPEWCKQRKDVPVLRCSADVKL